MGLHCLCECRVYDTRRQSIYWWKQVSIKVQHLHTNILPGQGAASETLMASQWRILEYDKGWHFALYYFYQTQDMVCEEFLFLSNLYSSLGLPERAELYDSGMLTVIALSGYTSWRQTTLLAEHMQDWRHQFQRTFIKFMSLRRLANTGFWSLLIRAVNCIK